MKNVIIISILLLISANCIAQPNTSKTITVSNGDMPVGTIIAYGNLYINGTNIDIAALRGGEAKNPYPFARFAKGQGVRSRRVYFAISVKRVIFASFTEISRSFVP